MEPVYCSNSESENAQRVEQLTKTSIPVFGPSTFPLYMSGMEVLAFKPAFSDKCLAITSKDLAYLAKEYCSKVVILLASFSK